MNDITAVKCSECNIVDRDDTLRNHVKKCHPQELSCTLCSFVSQTRHEKKRHLNIAHPWVFKYQCKFCPAKYKSAANLLVHLKSVHLKLKMLKCQLCDYSGKHGYNLARHLEAKHEGSSKMLRADLDDNAKIDEGRGVLISNNEHLATTDSKISPVREMVLGDDERRFEKEELCANEQLQESSSNGNCKESNASTNGNGNALITHVKTVNENKMSDLQVGNMSEVAFDKAREETSSYDVTVVQVRIKFNKCPHCDFSTVTNNLSRHVKAVHLKIKDNKCCYCDFTTCLAENLSRHLKAVHLKIKDKKCPFCDFVTCHNLTRHMVTVHQKNKDGKCLPLPVSKRTM
jgi:hypothetical protein